MPKSTRWTEKDSAQLASLYKQGLPDREIAERMRRSESAVRRHRMSLGCGNVSEYRAVRRVWTEEEDAVLRKGWIDGNTDAEIGERLGRKAHAVKQRRQVLGFTRSVRSPRGEWLPDEVTRLRALWQSGIPDTAIAAALGRSRAACKRKRADLGLVGAATDEPRVSAKRTGARLRNREPFSAQLEALRLENDARSREARPPLAGWTPGEPSPEARPLGKRSRRTRVRP